MFSPIGLPESLYRLMRMLRIRMSIFYNTGMIWILCTADVLQSKYRLIVGNFSNSLFRRWWLIFGVCSDANYILMYFLFMYFYLCIFYTKHYPTSTSKALTYLEAFMVASETWLSSSIWNNSSVALSRWWPMEARLIDQIRCYFHTNRSACSGRYFGLTELRFRMLEWYFDAFYLF